MTTFLIIADIVCVITAAANLAFASQARRTARNYSEKIKDVEQQEKGLQKRHNALDRWEHDLKEQMALIKKQQHVYVSSHSYLVTLAFIHNVAFTASATDECRY